MSFLGADTDDLREAGQKCQEGKQQVDEVISYLRALIMALRAASFFTGGASAAYAEYLESTVLPWLQRISQALGLMARVLMSNAQAQDDVSAGHDVDLGSLPTYASPSAAAPTSITAWDGELVPAGGIGAVQHAARTDAGSPPVPGRLGITATGAESVDDHSALTTLSGAGDVVAPGPAAALTPGLVSTPGGSDAVLPPGASGAGPGTAGPHGASGPIGAGVGSGVGSGGSVLGGEGLAGSGGLSSGGTLGMGLGGHGPGSGAGTADPASYVTGGAASPGLLGTTGGIDSGPGDGTGAAAGDPVGERVGDSGDTPSYGAAAGIAGGAAALGLGGAALAARSGSTDGRIHDLASSTGRGARGEQVTELQERLTAAGYDTRGTDGVWGRDTQAAYDSYRQAHPMEIRHGSGFTSPTGFDYSQITGVADNRNVTPAFLREVEGVAQRIGARPEHLMAVMSFETGGRFGADTPTQARGGTAVGLIQFTPVARQEVGATREQLVAMTPTQQLAYVERYFESRRGPHLGTVEGLYSAVLGGTGHTDPNRVMFREGDRAWEGNRGLDTAPRNGEITVSEAAQRVRNALSGR